MPNSKQQDQSTDSEQKLTKRQIREELRKQLAKHYPCYVLITADDPSDQGQMHVELSYEGDPVLAAYLLEGAQDFIDIDDVEEEPLTLRKC